MSSPEPTPRRPPPRSPPTFLSRFNPREYSVSYPDEQDHTSPKRRFTGCGTRIIKTLFSHIGRLIPRRRRRFRSRSNSSDADSRPKIKSTKRLSKNRRKQPKVPRKPLSLSSSSSSSAAVMISPSIDEQQQSGNIQQDEVEDYSDAEEHQPASTLPIPIPIPNSTSTQPRRQTAKPHDLALEKISLSLSALGQMLLRTNQLGSFQKLEDVILTTDEFKYFRERWQEFGAHIPLTEILERTVRDKLIPHVYCDEAFTVGTHLGFPLWIISSRVKKPYLQRPFVDLP